MNENSHFATECQLHVRCTVHTLLWKAMHFLYSYLRQACSSFSLLTIVYFFLSNAVHEVNDCFFSAYFQLFVYKSYIDRVIIRNYQARQSEIKTGRSERDFSRRFFCFFSILYKRQTNWTFCFVIAWRGIFFQKTFLKLEWSR